MEEPEIHEEVAAMIEAVEPQLRGGLVIIENEDWTESDNKVASFELQYMLTLNNLNHALQIQSLALKHNDHTKDAVIGVIFSLCQFYDIMQERYLRYYQDSENILRGLLDKKPKQVQGLSPAEKEMKFQGELTKKYQSLVSLHKKLLTLSDDTKISIETYGDNMIPIAMQGQMEELFPKIRMHLDRMEKQEREL